MFNCLQFLLIIILIIIISLLIYVISSNKESFETSFFIIKPFNINLYFYNFNDNMLTLSKADKNVKFFIQEPFISIYQTNLYLDFEDLNLYENYYIVRLLNQKEKVKNKWSFQKISENKYYIYQTINNQKVYLHISNQTLNGDFFNKTIFSIISQKI